VSALLRRIDAVNRAHPWSHNDHYIRWILRQLPPGARTALDVGCGTGNLLRALGTRVRQVDGIDRDPAMAAAAGARVADLLDLPARPAYDVVTSVAVLHHLPLRPALTRLRDLVRPGGRLLVVGCYRRATPADRATDLLAVPANLVLGLAKSAGEADARVAMSAPTAPAAETLAEIRAAAAELLPGAVVRRRLFWRYTLRWTRVSAAPAPG
jgi:SAM-dependent methyltransferase